MVPRGFGRAFSATRAPAVIAAVLVIVLGAGGALRLEAAGDTRRALSADEQSYLRLANDLRSDGTYGDPGMRHPFHWAPGTPAMFAAAAGRDSPLGDTSRRGPDRTAQAMVSTLTIAAAFGIAALLAGAWVGLAAAAALAFYPPAISLSSTFLSEPLGALSFALAILALAWAWRGRRPERFALAGAVLGLACLVRADLLATALVLPPAAAALLWHSLGRRAALVRGALMLAATLAVLAPWCIYASTKEDRFVPVVDGGDSTLFIATYLPGDGTVFGMKRALADETCRVHPSTCGRPVSTYRAEFALDAVAARHPEMSREAAISREARHNLTEYALGDPVRFAGLLAEKTWRLWGGYFRGRNVAADTAELWLHRVLVLGAFAGLLAGVALARRHRALLAVVLVGLAVATAVSVLFVAEARHNARMLPVLLAAGVAGWALAAPRLAALLRRER